MTKKPKKFKKKKTVELKKGIPHKVPQKEKKENKQRVVQNAQKKVNTQEQIVKNNISLSLKKDFRKILRKDFFEFFLQSFLMTGILLLLYIIFSLIIQTSANRLTIVQNTYTPHQYPYSPDKSSLFPNLPAYIIYEKDSHVVVDAKNEQYRFSPASTAKIMTALVSLEQYQPETILKARNLFSHQSVVQGSKMGLVEGEEMTVINLLYGLLLPSGNDAAFVLAENYPGGFTAFVNAMNEKAKKLHLNNTHFEDPAGFEDNNYTTAYDLARLAAEALNNKAFQEIVKTKHITIYNSNFTIPHELTNLNELLDHPGVTGIKTGFTNEAGGVLVTSYIHDGKTYIIIVMKSNDRFGDTRNLMATVVDNVQLLTFGR